MHKKVTQLTKVVDFKYYLLRGQTLRDLSLLLTFELQKS